MRLSAAGDHATQRWTKERWWSMKISLRKNTRKRTASITFRAENDREGVALKNAVLAVGVGADVDAGLPIRIVEELQKNGVEKADFDLSVVTPKPKDRRGRDHAKA